MDNGELELNQCNPYFVENRVSIRFSHGDILYSNILNVPIISHVKYNSTSDHLNITSGSIICKINDSEDNLSCTDCDSLLPKINGSLTISIRRLIPCRMHILNHSVLVLYHESSIQIKKNDSELVVGDFYLTEDGQVILIVNENSYVYNIRDSSISIMDDAIQCTSNENETIRIKHYSNQRNLIHSIVYCFYRILQIQQQAAIQTSSIFNTFSNSFVLFRGEIELFKKSQALFSWKPRMYKKHSTIILKVNSKVKLILHLSDLMISNDYSKILQEKNTSTKDRILWVNAKKEYHGAKRFIEEKEGKKDTKMLFRFSDKNTLMQFYRCIRNIVPEDHRSAFEYIHHSYSTVQRTSIMVEDAIVAICNYTQQLMQEGVESPSSSSKQYSPIIEQRGRELYELAMRLPAILKNPQILTQFLYTLNSTGITLQIWDLVICQFFTLLADTSQNDCIFQILCDIRNKETHEEKDEGNGKLVELLREKYMQLNSSLRHRRYSLYEKERDWMKVVIAFDVFEEYIRYFEKTVDRSLTKGNALSNLFDKYKESIQFGNAFSISNDLVIAASSVIETNAKLTAYLYVTNRFLVLVNMNDLLIIPLMAIQSCSTVNKSLHIVFTKFTTLPETSRFRTVLKLPSGNESKEKELILSLKFINKFLKREDYTSYTFVSTCLQEILLFYSTSSSFSHLQSFIENQPTKYLTSVFSSSSLSNDRSNQLNYLLLNFFRFYALLLQTGVAPSLVNQPVILPAVQSFVSILSTSEPDRDFERFDLILCKRELLVFFMLMNQISQFIKQLNAIIMFEIPGVSFFFFVCLNYIGLTNHMSFLFPFLLFCILTAWYFNYFDKSRLEGTTLQEALETRQIEKKQQTGKGIKNKLNSYMTSLNKFYSTVIKVNEILLKIRSLITWVDVDKTRIAILLLLFVIALFYFVPNNIVLLVITNFLFTKRWRDPDPPLKKYLRHFWNSIPLPAFSREQAALEELYND